MLLLRRAVAGRRDHAGLLTRRATITAGYAALLGTLAACGGTEPRVPAALTLSTNSLSFAALGEEQQLSSSITDQDGNPLPEETATWSSSNTGVASVSQTGLVTAEGAGTAEITATAGMARATAQATVVQIPAQLQKISGDSQTALAGTTLSAPFVVQVIDSRDNGIPGVVVTFSVSQGEGSVSTFSATTGADGTASTGFSTGTDSGSPQEVLATVEPTTLSLSFSAILPADPTSFNIGIRYLGTPTNTQRQAFTDARLRWEAAITQDLEDTFLEVAAGKCGSDTPAVSQEVDDLLIFVRLVPIDGPGGVLGGAGPCYVRDYAPEGTIEIGDLTILGVMQFDTDDLDMLEAEGLLSNVILHEMGHVLGFGTLWEQQGLLADPALPDDLPENPDADPHFIGAGAISTFNDAGGVAYTGGKVPVDNSLGPEGSPIPGTADSHWRESVFGNELMTGFIAAGSNPLSRVTLASLDDQGYGVDLSNADPFNVLPSLRAFGARPTLRLENDILRIPIKGVDSRGRVTGEIRR